MIPHNTDIEAELAIRQLAAAYTDAVNRGSADDAAEIWAPDAVLVFFGHEIHGVEAIHDGYRKTFGAFELLFQMTHSGLVHVQGDRATARWWISEVNKRPRDDDYGVFYGLYQDEVVRTEVGWRFARRQLDEIASLRTEYPAAPGRDRPPPSFVSL